MYSKIIKYISWALLLVGVAVGVLGFIVGFTENDAMAVDVLLYWAYAMVGIALGAIVLIGIYVGATTNPKGLMKSGLVLLGACAIIAIAYLIAPGTEAVGYNGAPVTGMTLKLTDTVLNLTYLSCGAAVLAIIVGSIVSATRK